MVAPVTRNLRDAVLKIEDGTTPTAKSVTVEPMEGDLGFEVEDKDFIVYNRGKIEARKQGDETPVPVSFSFKFSQWKNNAGSSGVSVPDALQGLGGAVTDSWVNADPCAPWSVNLKFIIKDPCNPTQGETLTFAKFHANKLSFKEGAEFNTVTVSGTALIARPESAFGAI